MIRYSLMMAMICTCLIVSSQTNEAAPETISRNDIQNLIVAQQLPNVSSTLVSNAIMIEQVGQGNMSFVNISSASSSVGVSQNGNGNDVAIALRGNNISESIFQLGSNNSVIDLSTRDASGAGLQVIQNGNNLAIERYGASRSSGPIKVTQSGNGSGRAVIVRQFK